MEDAGFSFTDVPVEDSIKIAMWKAIQHFKSNGLQVSPVSLDLKRTHAVDINKMFLGSTEEPTRDDRNWSGQNVRYNRHSINITKST